MTTTQVALFGSTAVTIPGYLADIFGDKGNIPAKLTAPQLSVKGSKFRIILDGEETVITRPNPDTNESEPVGLLKVVVLNVGARAARSYYTKKYDPANVVPPDCFSLDGEKPDPSVAHPQSPTCAACPQSQKGSKISEASGKAITACTMQRRLVVVPANKLDFEPLLLRLAPTSAWDKNNGANESNGWYAWQQYTDFLRANNVNHTAAVVTMIKFDSAAEYPKLLFKPERVLTQEEAAQIKEVWNGEKVRALLEAKEADAIGSVANEEEVTVQEDFVTPSVAPAPTAPAAPVVEPPKPTPAKVAPKAAPKVEKAAPKPEPAVQETPPVGSKLMGMLDDWGA